MDGVREEAARIKASMIEAAMTATYPNDIMHGFAAFCCYQMMEHSFVCVAHNNVDMIVAHLLAGLFCLAGVKMASHRVASIANALGWEWFSEWLTFIKAEDGRAGLYER